MERGRKDGRWKALGRGGGSLMNDGNLAEGEGARMVR